MKNATTKSESSKAQDAIELLTADHKKVKKLFKEFDGIKESEKDNARKAELVEQICMELTIHTMIEEEIFYPGVRDKIEDEDLVEEAEVEHASAKDLIAQLQGMKPGDEHYDAIVTVLGEQVEHHIKEEEDEMFPEVKKAKVDIDTLGQQMTQRKEELSADLPIIPQAAAQKPTRGHQPRA